MDFYSALLVRLGVDGTARSWYASDVHAPAFGYWGSWDWAWRPWVFYSIVFHGEVDESLVSVAVPVLITLAAERDTAYDTSWPPGGARVGVPENAPSSPARRSSVPKMAWASSNTFRRGFWELITILLGS